MAEQQPKGSAAEEQKPKRKLPLKTLLLILGVVLLEGGTIAVFMMFKGGPAHAEGGHAPIMPTVAPSQEVAEVVLIQEFRVGNYVAGRSQIMVTLDVTAKVAKSKETELAEQIAKHQTEIKDTIRTLIASAEPNNLKDPKLQVVKREIKAALEKIVGEGLIDEVLLPVWRTFTQE